MDRFGALLRGSDSGPDSEYFHALGAGLRSGAVLALWAAQGLLLAGAGEDDLGGRGHGLEDPVHLPADRRDDGALAGGGDRSLYRLPGGGPDSAFDLSADDLPAQLRNLRPDRDLLRYRSDDGRHLRRDGDSHGRLPGAHRRRDPLRRLFRRPLLARVDQRPAGGCDHRDKHL